MFRFYLRHQGLFVVLAVIFAFSLGLIMPELFSRLEWISWLFLNLLTWCALPVIFTSLVVVLGTLREQLQIKKIAARTMAYIVCSELIAVSIGLCVFNLFNLTTDLNARVILPTAANASSIDTHLLLSWSLFPLVFAAIGLGLLCSFFNKNLAARQLIALLTQAKPTIVLVLDRVMLLAPFALFVLIGTAVANSTQQGVLMHNLLGLSRFVALFALALCVHLAWQIVLLFALSPKLTLRQLLIEFWPIVLTAFVTSSSLATLPIAMAQAEELSGEKTVIEFMLPLCASLNFASGMMYEVTATLFFMHLLGIHPSLSTQLLLGLTAILTGIIIGGIPETSMISLVMVFNLFQIPLSAITLLMPLDRLIDRARTVVNITGNTCGALIVSQLIKPKSSC